MTIYKPKVADRKADVKKSPLKTAVLIQDVKPLTSNSLLPVPETVRVVQARRQRSTLLLSCCIFLVIVVIVVTALGGFFLYHRLTRKMHQLHYQTPEKAQFRYYEYQRSDAVLAGERKRVNLGSFVENIEIDGEEYTHERLDVPPILESRRSTVVHDFEKNLTAIVDRDMRRCFVLPLNRTAVQPPRNLMDLLIKYKMGYYLPDAEVVRDNYKVQLPAVDNVEQFGFYIWFDCRSCDTYRLVHDDVESRIISKRSACELSGDTYCLGSVGASKMMCLKLTTCA